MKGIYALCFPFFREFPTQNAIELSPNNNSINAFDKQNLFLSSTPLALLVKEEGQHSYCCFQKFKKDDVCVR
jgi:hypothetical protein